MKAIKSESNCYVVVDCVDVADVDDSTNKQKTTFN